MDLKKKRVLFIAPIFYDYHRFIQKELERLGAIVSFIPERDYSLRFTFVSNVLSSQLDAFQERHYLHFWRKNKNIRWDYLFVIRGYKMPTSFLKEFSTANPNAIKIMYQWDSEQNNPFSHLIPCFDRVLSFDRKDIQHNPNISYLPLFYTEDIALISQVPSPPQYDILFFGYYIPERYQQMLNIINFAKQYRIKLKTFMYIPFKRYLKEIIKGNFIRWNLISFRALKRLEYLTLLSQSKVVFDTSSNTQTGLAMRVIETIGAQKKLVTTNKMVMNEPFFNTSQILVISDAIGTELMNFIDTPVRTNKTTYSLSNWIRTIFSTE